MAPGSIMRDVAFTSQDGAPPQDQCGACRRQNAANVDRHNSGATSDLAIISQIKADSASIRATLPSSREHLAVRADQSPFVM